MTPVLFFFHVEFLQVSRCNSPSERRASKVSSRSRGSVCKHRGTPGHKCGHGGQINGNQALTNLENTNLNEIATKNGSNGRANSIHLMEKTPSDENERSPSWRERWQKFMIDRDDYSLWLFPPDHR